MPKIRVHQLAKDLELDSKKIIDVYSSTFVAFEGSHCVDYIDSNGYKRRICM